MKTAVLLLGAALVLLPLFQSQAGDAFFAADGKSVTFIPIADGGSMRKVDLSTKKVETIPLSLPKEENAIALVSGSEGEALVLTDKAAWVHDAKGTRKLAALGAIENPTDLIVASSKDERMPDWMLVVGSEKDDASRRIYFYRKPGDKEFKPVFCRRTGTVGDGVITADGRFFFGADGDLWEGGFETEDPELIALTGVRIAPLGVLNTDSANGGSMYVDRVMPAGQSVYVALGGHHMGQLVRVDMNPKPALNEESGASGSVKDHYAYLAKSLASTAVIDDSGEPIRNAAAISADGDEMVFYTTGGGTVTMHLWKKSTGKSEELGTFEVQ